MTYKHFFLFAAFAGAALASCTKTEIAPVKDKDIPLSFNTAVGVPTKAEDITTAKYPQDQNFKVWALYTAEGFDFDETTYTADNSSDFMKGVEQEYSSTVGGWKAKTGNYYWPKAGYLTFWAVSPATAAPTVTMAGTSNTISLKGFAISDTNPDSTKDLLFSDINASKQAGDYTGTGKDDTDTDNDKNFGNYKGVNIYFHHALSRIEFKAQLGANINNGEEIKITNITVNNAAGSGDMTVTATQALGEGTSLTSKFTSREDTVEWDVTDKAATELKPLSTETDALTTTAVAIGNARLVIPQATTAVQFTVTVKSKIGNVTATKDYTFALGASHGNKWEWGKKYVYTITVKEDEILFDPAVSDWGTAVETEHSI